MADIFNFKSSSMTDKFSSMEEYGIGPQSGVQILNSFEMCVLVDGAPREVYMLNNMPNIVPQVGSEYKIRLYNRSDKDIMCQLVVDGVSVLGGWDVIIKAQDHFTFKGFSKGDNHLASFVFAPLKKSKNETTQHTYNKTPDYNIGLISCEVYECENKGIREGTDSFGSSTSPSVKKDMTKGVNDKKKCDVVTGEGKLTKDLLTLSKYRYVRRGLLGKIELRYNAIGEKVPTAEIDEEFMKEIDYE